ncbi:hypothetical protein ACE1SV_66180 [Streptomyces sp. E-15]
MDVAARCQGKAGRKRDRRGLHVIDTGDIDVFLGLDVGKGEHHATAVTPAGKAFDKRLPNTEPKLRELFAKRQAKRCAPTWSTLRSRASATPDPPPRSLSWRSRTLSGCSAGGRTSSASMCAGGWS